MSARPVGSVVRRLIWLSSRRAQYGILNEGLADYEQLNAEERTRFAFMLAAHAVPDAFRETVERRIL
jgi:hypothetical protein